MKNAILFITCLCVFNISHAQTFNGGGGSIPDNGPAAYYPVTVSGLSSTVLDSSFGVESVCINIIHNNVYQLTIQIVAPDGTTIDLSLYNGGTGNNYTNTCFTASATNSITSGSPPFTGSYKAEGILGNLNNGQNGNGLWRLKVQDHNPGSSGNVISWSLTFSNTPALPFIYSSSNLPIVVINTLGQTIVDDPKINVQMGIIDNGFGIRNYLTDPFTFSGNIGIEIRGSWSQTFPQQQYGFETLDSLYIETDTTILGMPSESDWILNAPYNDKTCMRNVVVYDIANKTGHYASRSRFCELVINGDYKGIYVMLEKVKRDNNRVDISNLLPTDTAGVDLTGGYIIKIDKPTGSGGGIGWNSAYDGFPGTKIKFQYEYPSYDVIAPQQAAYIRAYVDSFEDALAASYFADPVIGYRKYIEVQSFIDYFILNETCKNVDSYRLSTFLHKQKITKGGKLVIGPAWDYNIAFNNADYCQGFLSTGWQYQFNNICGTAGDNNVPFWWARLLQDPAFANQLKCRWEELRLTTLNVDTLWNQIDSIALFLDEAKDRHFFKWPILGVQTWANPSPIPADYPGEISKMKGYIVNRMAWLDANMPGTCVVASIADSKNGIENIKVYPNPFNDQIRVQLNFDKSCSLSIELQDISGHAVLIQNSEYLSAGYNEVEVNTKNKLESGIYFLKITSVYGIQMLKIVRN